jgi:hypothetical protein
MDGAISFYDYYTASRAFCQQVMRHTLLLEKNNANIWTFPAIAYETPRLLLRKNEKIWEE